MFKLSRLPVVTGALLLSLGATFFANSAFADPSGRVAYLSDTQGTVSYSPSGENQWIGVVRNRPLIRGDRLWSDQNSRVEFQVGSSVVRLGQNTGVELLDLDDNIAQLQLSEGSINVRVRRLYRGQTIEVATPMLAFSINRRGRYRIDVDPYDGQTTVTVWRGAGTAYGQQSSFRVRAGEAVAFYDVYLTDYEIYGVADDDDFDLYAQDRDRYWDESVSLNYVGDDVVGYAALDLYGSWGTHQNYGNVWYPRDVARDWAPYRDGHWVWQEPWGWTWVDNAPWGFAPSHYGRWVSVRNRWGWVPGPRNVRPIYAPAVVAFVGGSGWSLSLSLGGGSSAIGWFPLGPREVYVPSYHTSRDYFNRVNVNNTVINNTTITNVYNNYSSGDINVNQVNYVNSNVSSAVTAVPSNVFVNAQPVRQAALRFDNQALQGTEITRIAPLTPIERSVLGAGKAVKNQPKREVFDRRVVAYNTPPPAQVEFAKREKQLQKQPGRALEPAAVDTAQGTYTRPVKNVLVINDQKEVIDSRASRKDTTAQPGKSERLDRSAIAKHKAGRVRSAEQLPGADKQAVEQQQRKAASDKQSAEQQQRKGDSDKQAAEQQQRKAASDKQAAEQQQRKAANDKQAADQQRKAESDKQAAEQQQRKAASDKQAAEQQQRKADSDRQAAEQQQRKAASDRQAAEQQQRKAESDKQAVNESAAQQPQPRQDKPANEQQPKSKAQAECEREARKQGKDDSACKDL
jgi:hypothetical protein